MVHGLKLIGMFLLGGVIGLASAWPRVTPETRYFADGDSHWYHADTDCEYGSVKPYPSRRAAEEKNLNPCPKCVQQARARS